MYQIKAIHNTTWSALFCTRMFAAWSGQNKMFLSQNFLNFSFWNININLICVLSPEMWWYSVIQPITIILIYICWKWTMMNNPRDVDVGCKLQSMMFQKYFLLLEQNYCLQFRPPRCTDWVTSGSQQRSGAHTYTVTYPLLAFVLLLGSQQILLSIENNAFLVDIFWIQSFSLHK